MGEFKNNIPIAVVLGPTASGKTELGIMLAKRLNGEIISADSMQIYKGMDIATAKPTLQEQQGIPHHLMGEIDPNVSFSVAEYVKLANRAVDDILNRKKFPIVVGGTGQYIDALINGILFPDAPNNPEVRKGLQKQLETQGPHAMLARLSECDPEYAKTLHVNNTKRILRGIEVYQLTGIPMSVHLKNSRMKSSRFSACKIGLKFHDRALLYRQIDRRVDHMIDQGLLKEAQLFLKAYSKDAVAAQAIGYKELFPYFLGEQSLPNAIEILKRQTRRYAKRQLTWFRRDTGIHWFERDRIDMLKICEQSQNIIENLMKVCYNDFTKQSNITDLDCFGNH